MMVERIWFGDVRELDFVARVTESRAEGGCLRVELDRTAFCPTSGGQPHDTGFIGDRRVTDVVAAGDRIVHVLEGTSPVEPGTVVEGRVDGERRRDHTQQHSAQHLLSRAARVLAGASTVGFHLGTDVVTVDLDPAPERPEEFLRELEALVNGWVMENRAVTSRMAGAKEASGLTDLPIPGNEDPVRLVIVDGLEANPCSGTHVARTGDAGPVVVLGSERVKRGSLRVSFVAGRRAVAEMSRRREILAGLRAVLSSGDVDLVKAAATMHASLLDARKRVDVIDRQLQDLQAPALIANPSFRGAGVLVLRLPDMEAESFRRLASALGPRLHGDVAVLVAGGAGERRLAVVAGERSPIAAGAAIRAITGRFGGKGGGSSAVAFGALPAEGVVDDPAVAGLVLGLRES